MQKLEKFYKNLREKISKFDKNYHISQFIFKNRVFIVFLIITGVFSFWLMFSTLRYSDGNILVEKKLFSDFLNHLPLIRSFSQGDNFPVEYPLYSGEPIRYHFLFYLLVAVLEKIGFRIDIALNLMSFIGLWGMLIMIYKFSYKMFKSNMAAMISGLLVLLNPSFSWIYYLFTNDAAIKSFTDLKAITLFPAFGPYNESLVSAFWSLNIFTNQRHLAFSIFLGLLAVYFVYYSKNIYKFIIALVIVGLMSWMHKAVLLFVLLLLVNLFIFTLDNNLRKKLFVFMAVSSILIIPGLIYLNKGGLVSDNSITIKLGFLYKEFQWEQLSTSNNEFAKWIIYWIFNLGILPFMMFSGLFEYISLNYVKLRKKTESFKTVFKRSLMNEKTAILTTIIILFAATNLFRFSPDIGTNHKFINISILLMNIFAGYLLFTILKNREYIIACILFFILIFGGLFDLLPVFNSRLSKDFVVIKDIQSSDLSQWVVNNTPKDSKFFNTTDETLELTLTGRRIFWGTPYFSWGIGYDTLPRNSSISTILSGSMPKQDFCNFLKNNNLSYILMSDNSKFYEHEINYGYFEENFLTFEFNNSNYKIINVANECGI